MLACTLPGVTPPLVNTGLEVSSVDKNTLASQQRGRKARILLSYCALGATDSTQKQICLGREETDEDNR